MSNPKLPEEDELNKTFLPEFSDGKGKRFLLDAYKSGNLVAAKKLMELGANFEIRDFISIKPILPKDKYLKHFNELKELGLINERQSSELSNIVVSMFNGDSNTYNSASKTIGTLIYTHDNNQVVQNIISNIPINDVTRTVMGVWLASNFPRVLSHEESSLEDYLSQKRFYKLNIGNPSNENYLKNLIYGLTRSAMEHLGNANFYQKDDKHHFHEFQIVRNEVMNNVLKEFDTKGSSQYFEDDILTSDLLYVKRNLCWNTADSDIAFYTASAMYQSGQWNNSRIYEDRTKQFVDHEVGLLNQKPPVFYEMLFLDYSLKDSESLYENIQQKYGLNREDNKFCYYSVYKREFYKAIDKYCAQQDSTAEYKDFIDRIFNYAMNDWHFWKTGGLLPVFVQAYSDKNPDEKVLKILEPMYKYWQQYIVPEADELMKKNFSPPLRVFMKEEKNLIDKTLEFLGLPSEDRNWPSIYEKELELSELHPEYNMTEELLSFNITQCLDGTHTCD